MAMNIQLGGDRQGAHIIYENEYQDNLINTNKHQFNGTLTHNDSDMSYSQ